MCELDYPVQDVYQILRACKVDEPLQPGDKRWHDFANLRHSRIVSRLERIFKMATGTEEFHHRTLCGHRGSGKSTELLRFKAWADGNRFAAERTEVNIHFGQIQLQFSDLFLLAATTAESVLKQLGRPLPANALKPLIDWFAEVTKEDKHERASELSAEAEAQAGGKLPFLGSLVAKFASATKAGSSHATTVRNQMRSYPDQLIDRTNALLKQAQESLKELGRDQGLIVIFDNLDRYEPGQIAEVLLRGSSLLARLGCHAVYTMPIDLAYGGCVGPSRDTHGQALVIPMISLRGPDDCWRANVEESPYREDAVKETVDALGQRIAIPQLFEDPADARRLVKLSGGCIRDLMHLVTLSYETSEGDRLTRAGVAEAVHLLRAEYARALSGPDYARLAEIAARRPVERDDLTKQLLFNRQALEYFDGQKVWMDVHPIILEIHEFQTAYAEHRRLAAG